MVQVFRHTHVIGADAPTWTHYMPCRAHSGLSYTAGLRLATAEPTGSGRRSTWGRRVGKGDPQGGVNRHPSPQWKEWEGSLRGPGAGDGELRLRAVSGDGSRGSPRSVKARFGHPALVAGCGAVMTPGAQVPASSLSSGESILSLKILLALDLSIYMLFE